MTLMRIIGRVTIRAPKVAVGSGSRWTVCGFAPSDSHLIDEPSVESDHGDIRDDPDHSGTY